MRRMTGFMTVLALGLALTAAQAKSRKPNATRAVRQGVNLKRLVDFDGNYSAVDAGPTAAGGGGVAAMRDQNGVTVELVTITQGVAIGLGGAGVDMKIKK